MKVRRLLPVFVLAALLLYLPAASFADVSIGISVGIAPPPLPVYAQPYCPGPNFIWTPGYWAWNGYDYYWVPGTWVMAPSYGLLWTPGWWGWGTGGYFWHAGYWGPHMGFYGGVNYGYGYYGRGYEGGYWHGNNFYYNSAVSNVNTTVIKNVYVNKTVINNVNVNNTRVSYNGGQGGIQARANSQEQTALSERRMGPDNAQMTHQNFAQQDRANFFKNNRGVPQTAALARPAASMNDFRRNAVPARPVNGGLENRTSPVNRQENNVARPGTRPAPINNPGYHQENNARPMTNGQPGNTDRPSPTQRPTYSNRPSPETRPAPQNRPENTQRPEARPTPQPQRPEAYAARPEMRPAPQPQQQRPSPQFRTEPQPQAHYSAPRPEPQQQMRPAPQPRPDAPSRGAEHGHR